MSVINFFIFLLPFLHHENTKHFFYILLDSYNLYEVMKGRSLWSLTLSTLLSWWWWRFKYNFKIDFIHFFYLISCMHYYCYTKETQQLQVQTIQSWIQLNGNRGILRKTKTFFYSTNFRLPSQPTEKPNTIRVSVIPVKSVASSSCKLPKAILFLSRVPYKNKPLFLWIHIMYFYLLQRKGCWMLTKNFPCNKDYNQKIWVVLARQ